MSYKPVSTVRQILKKNEMKLLLRSAGKFFTRCLTDYSYSNKRVIVLSVLSSSWAKIFFSISCYADPPLLLIIPVLSHASVAVVITEKGKEPRLVVHNLSHLEKSVSNYADGEILFYTTLEKEAVADPAAG